MWPSLAAVPYLWVFLSQVWRWAACSTQRFSASALHCFQLYIGKLCLPGMLFALGHSHSFSMRAPIALASNGSLLSVGLVPES